jgi:hypothetical protein
MQNHYITELSSEEIGCLSNGQLRDLIRHVDLPLSELGTVSEKLEQLDRNTLVRLVFQIRRQYLRRKVTSGGQEKMATLNASQPDGLRTDPE